MRTHIVLYLNGKRLEVGPQHAKLMLADYLRYIAGLSGTKIVCAEGDCGACTVLRSFGGFSKNKKTPENYLPLNSCIVTVAQMDGSSLVTVDALEKARGLTPTQKAMMNCHGSQCGFCTPGFVMAMTGLVEKKLKQKVMAISDRDAKNALTGNLCRCTGYQPIIDAAKSIDLKNCESVSKQFSSPAQIKDLQKVLAEPVTLKSKDYSFLAPTTIKQAIKELSKNKHIKLLGGATDLGVVHNKWRSRMNQLLSLHLIPELYKIEFTKGKNKSSRIQVGARVTLADLREELKDKIPEFAHFLDLFASPQIKNFATLIGNVATASPIADTPPFLLISGAQVNLIGAKGARSLPIEKFFLGYRKTAIKPHELIHSISFDLPLASDFLSLKKISERKDLDISSVNTAFKLSWDNKELGIIKTIRLAVGGVAGTTVRLNKTEKFLLGKPLDPKTLDAAVEILHSEISPLSDLRGTSAFRRVLVENLFRRFCSEAQR